MGGYAQIWADVFRYGDMSRFGPIWTKWAQQKVTKFGDFLGDAIYKDPSKREKYLWPGGWASVYMVFKTCPYADMGRYG